MTLVHTARFDDFAIANDGCLFAVGNGAHRKLRLAGHSNLAYKHQVKGGVERRGDFRCNKNPAARQRQNDGTAGPVFDQGSCQPSAGMDSVLKEHVK